MNRKYGIALSGGAVRGIAHLGVLKALEENQIKPTAISGVSAGSIAAVFIADGYSSDEILEFFKGTSFYKMLGWKMGGTGLFRLDGLRKLLESNLRHTYLEELEIPCFIGVSNLTSSEFECFQSGDIIEAVLASCSVPLLFEPVSSRGAQYIDGGVLNNLPSKILEENCDFIIGSDVLPLKAEEKPEGFLKMVYRVFSMIAKANSVQSRAACDLLICPEELAEYSFVRMEQEQELYKIGYSAAIEKLRTI